MNLPDEVFARQWEAVDWDSAKAKLKKWQKELSLAALRDLEAYRRGKLPVFGRSKEIVDIQKRIVRDLDIKCLAVQHVASSTSSPGVDGIRWQTPAEMMRAAMSLTSKGYVSRPMRQILIVAKNTGKERRAGLPTWYDRAMHVLYGYSLLPVIEAQAERKSFAFRKCRSTQDAHSYIMEALKGNNAPEYVVCTDIKAYYSHIQHAWLLEHAPMDRGVLAAFLDAGTVFAGELFPPSGEGISEGDNLSPYLGNFVLDGLQWHIYRGLHGTGMPKDFADGNCVRFADDVFVTVRTRETGEKVVALIRSFLEERGLTMSKEKTRICAVSEGFTFMSRTYERRDGLIYSYPSEAAVQRFISGVKEVIHANKRSQRVLIETLNKKLMGWGEYHRFCDAEEAFRQVDTAVQAALLEAAMAKHPKQPKTKVKDLYWFKEASGRHCFALPHDKSVRVIRLADAILLHHDKVKTNVNPFLDEGYIERREHDRAIQNVTGPYKAIWNRQKGLCHYCGRPILGDQQRAVVPLNLTKAPSVRNSAYIHKICAQNEFELVHTMEDVDSMRVYDVMKALEEVSEGRTPGKRVKREINVSWRHNGLKQHLAKTTAASVTLKFSDIEKLDGRPLAKSARERRDWWYPRNNCNTIAEAWLTEGYTLEKLDLKKEKLTLRRSEDGLAKLKIPAVLINGKIPEDARYELERHMEYIIKKYGL